MMADYDEDEDEGGIHFDPYDYELIKEYLKPKLRDTQKFRDFIGDKDVYAKEPWLLVLDDHGTKNPYFKENEWYYFATRTQVSEKKIGYGKKTKRKIKGDNDDEGGRWKENSRQNILDEETGQIIGLKRCLTYMRTDQQKKNKKQKTGGDGSFAIASGSDDKSWLMKEYMLPDTGEFHKLVLCKIHVKISKKKDDEASTSSLEQQQPLLCGGDVPLKSITCCPVAETEKDREQSGEGDMIYGLAEAGIDISSGSQNDDQEQNAAGDETIVTALGSETKAKEKEIDWFQELGLRVEQGDRSCPMDESFYSSEKQPVDEAHSPEKDDVSAAVKERNREKSESLVSSLAVNGSGLLEEEDNDSTQFIDEDLLDQYAASLLPLLGDGNGQEIPLIASSPAETERNNDQNGQGKVIEQVTPDAEKNWLEDYMNMGPDGFLTNTEDNQQPPISAPAHRNAPHARLGDKSLPVEVDEEDKDELRSEFPFLK